MNRKREALLLGIISLMITPFGLVFTTVVVERRDFVLADQYLSFLFGDACLALAVFFAAFFGRDRPWRWTLVVVPVALGIGVGTWQMHSELVTGAYSPAQAFSPGHLYHQFLVYPLLGIVIVRAAQLARGSARAMTLMACCVLVWAALMVWDQSHPKSPHADFDWPWSENDVPTAVD